MVKQKELFCSKCYQNFEHCQCTHTEVTHTEVAINEVTQEVIQRIEDNRNVVEPSSQKYWDHVHNHFVNFKSISLQDSTRIAIIKHYPNG